LKTVLNVSERETAGRRLSWKTKMRHSVKLSLFFLISSVFSYVSFGETVNTSITYYGTSDASAAVAVGERSFVAADDENNTLRVYRTDRSSLPVYSCDLTSFLCVDPNRREADIEGAAAVGDIVYWISSHGRNKDGKMRESRYRFFATSIKINNGDFTITPVGTPCRTLIHEIIRSGKMQQLRLDEVTRFGAELKKKDRKKLAPKKDGLNIEGLCAAPDGKTLYIGFRNPQFLYRATSRKDAIIVPLLNPDQVIEKRKRPIYGSPILLNLGGLGIRSIEYSRFHKSYFIIAGAHDERPEFALYKWLGPKEQPVLVKKFPTDQNDLTPEALVVFEKTGRLFVLSDDGSIVIDVPRTSDCFEGEMVEDGKCPNKYLSDQSKKSFRGMWLEL